jgi:hypothetical protein
MIHIFAQKNDHKKRQPLRSFVLRLSSKVISVRKQEALQEALP